MLLIGLRRRLVFRFGALLPALVLAAILTGIRPIIAAEPPSLHSLVNRLQEHYRTTDSFTANFVETLTSPGGAPRIRKGKVSYRKPGLIRWEFSAPQPETIVADGTTLYDYDPGLNQVVETPERTAFKNRSVAAFLLGAGDLARDFKVAASSEVGTHGVVWLTLTPNDGGRPIEAAVDRQTLDITQLRITDSIGNKTLLQLSDMQRNVPLSTSDFAFSVPAGADIVNTAPGQ